ncbi:hypothetical protein [Edaphocola flava]|uniref:hypothetical protein n=1 Tax=Edaphocola flava TaxID=2499629 RepID=UPI00100A3A08|nr:hypothetical protein [Edaphocola flava]
MKRAILTLSIITTTVFNGLHAQSGQMQIMEACADEIIGKTYVNRKDGQSLTFYKNGQVAINNKLDKRYKYELTDCVVELYFNSKMINTLKSSIYWFEEQHSKKPFIKDKRGIIYSQK